MKKRTSTLQLCSQMMVHTLGGFRLITEFSVRYNSSTQQIVELRVKNVEAEEFLNPHSDQIKRKFLDLKNTY
jgi:hypothetical protein